LAIPDLPSEEEQRRLAEQADLLARVETRLAQERADRELALIAQEHRLIPAISNLITVLIAERSDQRRQQLPKAASALFWCLIPSGGTAAIGLVALLSLLIAWQQVQLLAAQNQKIEVQNILAEAQRRSGLMFETSAIFQQIEAEKDAFTGRKESISGCTFSAHHQCWRDTDHGRLFIPSNATNGRLVALTQALRPYRYLSVEDQGPYRFRDGEKSKDICPELFDTDLLEYASNLIGRVGEAPIDGKADPDTKDIAAIRTAVDRHAREPGMTSGMAGGAKRWTAAIRGKIRDLMNATLPDNDAAVSSISCRASSPERGQLLIALHAASVDISHIAAKGADFRYADLPAGQLKGIQLSHVDLSYSRLPGASFEDAVLENVDFSGAHLAGAKFKKATLKRVVFSGAIVQAGAAQATNASLLFAKTSDTSLEGIRLLDIGNTIPFFPRWCMARELANKIAGSPISLDRFALVTETRTYADGAPPLMLAVVVRSTMNQRHQLIARSEGPTQITIVYEPFSLCSVKEDGASPANATPSSR
jgi:hypothetical protein